MYIAFAVQSLKIQFYPFALVYVFFLCVRFGGMGGSSVGPGDLLLCGDSCANGCLQNLKLSLRVWCEETYRRAERWFTVALTETHVEMTGEI